MTFVKHILLLLIVLPIELRIGQHVCASDKVAGWLGFFLGRQGSWAGPAWFWLGGPKVLGRAGLAFISRLDTATIFRLENSIILRLDIAIIFHLAIYTNFVINTHYLIFTCLFCRKKTPGGHGAG